MFESARDILKPKHGGVGVGHGFSKLQVLTLWRIELLGMLGQWQQTVEGEGWESGHHS